MKIHFDRFKYGAKKPIFSGTNKFLPYEHTRQTFKMWVNNDMQDNCKYHSVPLANINEYINNLTFEDISWRNFFSAVLETEFYKNARNIQTNYLYEESLPGRWYHSAGMKHFGDQSVFHLECNSLEFLRDFGAVWLSKCKEFNTILYQLNNPDVFNKIQANLLTENF